MQGDLGTPGSDTWTILQSHDQGMGSWDDSLLLTLLLALLLALLLGRAMNL